MNKCHIIEDAEFDISFDSMAIAREHEPGLADFIRERLLPLADEIFCELSDGGMVVRIDRLELDLGDIRQGEFCDEMESRFGEKLRAILREKMQSIAATHTPFEGLIGRPQGECGQMEVFLETGRMPWHDHRATGDAVDAMLEQTLARQGYAFVEFMKRTPHRDVVVKRLARQFPDRLLIGVMRLLAPAHAVLLGELTGKLGDMWKDMSASITAKELKAQVWERLIGEHLKTGVPDPERLLREIARDLFVRYTQPRNVPAESGVSAGNLPGRKPKGEARGSVEAGNEVGDEMRVDASLAASAAKQLEASSDQRSNIARQRAQLETAFSTGDAGELAGQWEALRNDHRELVREVFMRRMGDGKLLKKLAEGFPESMLLDLLNILSPQDSGFMVALSGLPELRGANNEKNAAFWRYTLGHLHDAQDGDRAEYARGLIRSLSAEGMEQRPLLKALVALAPELQAVLADMQTEPVTGSRSSAEDPARAEELYRRVTQRLNGTSREPEFAALLEEMASAYPEMLVRLQRQLQSGELHADVGMLDAREAGQMAEALIRLNSGVKESDFLRAVEAQAQHARDRQRYYRQILERLIRNETVDLEAALDEADNEAVQQRARTDSVGDAAPGQKLSAQQDRQADEQERITRLVAEFAGTGRAAELYRRVTQRLSGASGGEPEFSALVEEMASIYPDTLTCLQRQLKSGELRAQIGVLDAGEARQLVESLIRLNSGAKESDFLRAIGRYAGRAKSERGYYQRILENMIRNRTIDLEDAVRSQGEIVPRDLQRTVTNVAGMEAETDPSSRQEDHATVGAEPELESVKLLRIRLEEALVLGHAEGVEAVWGELLLNHVAMLREIFAQRLDNEVARSRLVEGFSEPMLHGLIHALAPADGGFIEMLAGQPELRAGGAAGEKNIPLLEYTLSYLHACGTHGYDRFEYANGLVRSLAEQGRAQADILRAIVRIDPELGGAMTASGGEIVSALATSGEGGGADSSSQGLLAGTLIRNLLQRLRDRDRTLAQEIGELAGAWPEVAREFYRHLQSDVAALDVAVLSAREASLHAAAFIVSNHGRMGDDFLREIKLHAGKARDELHYYRTILEMLLRNRVVDLEAAMITVPGSEAGEEESPVRARMDDAPGIGAMRSRFESALIEGEAEAIADVWDELRFNRGALVREVFNLRMGEGASRKKLAERFPEAMLFELMRVLAPLASGFIESLDKQLGLLGGVAKAGDIRLAAREYALAYIYAFGARDFKRDDYARGLMHRMAVQGMDAGIFWRAMAAIDPVLTLSLPESRIGGTPRIGGAARVGDMPSPVGGATRVAETQPIVEKASRPAPHAETGQTAELYERLVLHLSRQEGRDVQAVDYSREIAELADAHPETLKRLYRRLQTDELDMDALSPSAGEARQLAVFFAGLSQGNEGKDFPREIDARAGKAKDERAFYRHILEKLVRNQVVDFDVAMNEAQQTPDRIDRLRTLLESAFATGEVGELAGPWDALRSAHRELVREVFMQRMGDDKLLKKLTEGFPEPMLLDLLNILSPQGSGFMVALSALPELRGAKNEKNAVFWIYTLGFLHRAQDGDRAEYARGLIRSLSAQGMEQGPLLQALVVLAPELQAALADMKAQHITGTRSPAEEPARATEPGRAEELYRRVTQRLNGTSGEPEFAALLEEMASACPEMLARLQRQLQSGELRADVGTLDAGEARQLVVSLIRLDSGAKESGFLRAIEAQAQQARDRQRYYRYVLERLIRNKTVDLEAARDDAALGNDAMPQAERHAPAGDTARNEESMQARNAAHTSDEITTAARSDYLRALLDTALSEGNAGELVDAWDEIGQRHAGIVRESFQRRMGDEGARQRVAQGFPETLLAELVRILVPAEYSFIETLAAQLQQEQGGVSSARNAPLWKYTMSYLHATASRGFDRRDYVGGLMSCLSEQGMSRAGILQAVTRIDVAQGQALSTRQDMRAGTQEEIARAAAIGTSEIETDRAGELYRRVTGRLSGVSGEPEFAALVEEMASACPETLAHLLRQLQAGKLRADIGTLDAREAREMVTALIRLNSGVQESEFLRAVDRYAARAKSEAGYYRFILENLLLDRAIDLEEAASVVVQEAVRPADDRGEENKALPGATSGDKQRPQMAEDFRPRATTGDEPMQVKNTSSFDEHWSKDAGDSESVEEIYIANAGMVLATPYLPRLFGMLELTEGSKFKDERSAERAIHLLQFMVNESCDSPEFLLSLNKLLCGVPTGVPIVREIELLRREKEAIEGMLNGIILNWTILGNTSVQGLRESFLQRSGRLQLKEDNWHLKVESKGIDVLLDRLPWSFALIKHPWMRRPIYVEWR